MTSLSEYARCISLSRLEFYDTGGSLWDWSPRFPPGTNSLRLPNRTEFKVALEGPRSSIHVNGFCLAGSFVVQRDPGRGEYESANQAVKHVRGEKYTSDNNAWIHVLFKVGSSWISADDMRHRKDLSVPESYLEVPALLMARKHVGKQFPGLADGEAERKALSVLPNFIEAYRVMGDFGADDPPR